MNNQQQQILATFAITKELKNQKKEGQIHLICSIMKYDKIISIENLIRVLNLIKERRIIIRITIDKSEKMISYKHSEYLFEYNLTVNDFLFYLNEIDNYTGLFEDVFGKINNEKKDFNSLNNDVLFIFEDIEWYNVVLMFKTKNIMISGGTITRRHKINTAEVNLITFLMYLENFKLNRNLIYENYKDDLLKNFYDENNSKELINNFNERNQQLNHSLIKNMIKKENEILLINQENIIKGIETKISEIENEIKNISSILLSELEVRNKKLTKKDLRNIKNKNLSKINVMKEKLKIKLSNLNKNLVKNKDLLTIEKANLFKIKNKIELMSQNKEYSVLRSENKIIGKYRSNLQIQIQKRKYSTSVRNKEEIIKKHDSKHLTYLLFLDEILNSINNDPLKAQEQIETEWTEYMMNKIDNPNSKIRKNLSFILKQAAETLNLHLENKNIRRKFPKYYDKLNKNHLIITLSIICTYYNILGFTRICMIIANNIMINIYMKEYSKNNELSFTEFLNKFQMNDGEAVNKLKLGSFFIEIFCQFPTPIFIKSYKKSDLLDNEVDNNPISILEINDDYIDTIQNNVLIPPTSLPMICKPNLWSDNEYGGFVTNKIIKHSLITGSENHSHKIQNKELLYNTINYLNSIKFKINNNLLIFLEGEGKVLMEHYFNKLESKSEILNSKIKLTLAKSYSKLNIPIYISTNSDWRGRIYTQSFFITYQGDDLSSALLMFYEGEILTDKGLYYLYIYGANCYNDNNISKKSYKDRINWVKNNYDKIINLDINFIMKAESMFLFTSFCLAIKDIHFNNKSKVYLPVFLDATCSGIQHLAALLKDIDIGKKVNLIPQTDNDVVQDIYFDLIDPINKAINEYGKNNIEYEKFINIKLRREHVKIPIMTKNYNVSIIGIANQLRSSLKKIDKLYMVPTNDNYVLLNYYQIFLLAQIIDQQIFKSLPSLKIIYDYFKNISRLINILNIPML